MVRNLQPFLSLVTDYRPREKRVEVLGVNNQNVAKDQPYTECRVQCNRAQHADKKAIARTFNTIRRVMHLIVTSAPEASPGTDVYSERPRVRTPRTRLEVATQTTSAPIACVADAHFGLHG